MKKAFLFGLCFIVGGLCYSHAQSISQEVICSDGEYVTEAQIPDLSFRLEYTVGEIATETLVGSTFKLTQGFHQPSLMVVSVRDLFPELSITVFPNPTTDQVNIRLTEDLGELHFQLFDINGKAISPVGQFNGLDQRLDMKTFPAGNYFLHIQGVDAAKHKTFKIIKTQ